MSSGSPCSLSVVVAAAAAVVVVVAVVVIVISRIFEERNFTISAQFIIGTPKIVMLWCYDVMML